MSDIINDFLAAMSAHGFTPKDGKVWADDKWHPAYYGAEKGSKATGAYTITIVEGDFAIGCYFTRKNPDQKHSWHSKSENKLTAEEKKRIKAEIAAAQKRREQQDHKRQKRISDLLTRWYKAQPAFTGTHPYLEAKGIKSHGIKHRKKGNELVIPCYGTDGKVWTIQRITARGSKFLWAGGRKKGSYFPLANTKDDMSVILVCEGFSTGASIRQATSLPVVAAIDSGNLKPVLEALKKKFPNSRFVLCADNDEFTRDGKGEFWNVGRIKAHEAAVAIGGASEVAPSFIDNTEEKKLSDFNDLHHHEGLNMVRQQIMEVVSMIPAKPDVAGGTGESPMDETRSNQQPSGDDNFSERFERDFDPITIEQQGDFNLAFRCLGYNGGTNYYFSFRQRRIVALNASQHTLQNLLQLDSLERWETSTFGAAAKSEKKIGLYAQNGMNQLCTQRGVFKEEDTVRGGGAWLDEGRLVVHCGDRLFVDGGLIGFDEMQSEYTYIAAPKFMRPATEQLSGKEAVELRKICESVTWENKLSGSLLAGWLVIAPVCGALDYRPHIWVTGEALSGKSTVIKKIVRRVLGRMAMNYESPTTEAKIREVTGHDARPLVYDEAEPRPATMGVIELARLATTGSVVGKFGQNSTRARMAVCFASITPPIDKTADESRISFLSIKKNRKASAMQDYDDLLAQIDKHLTPEFSDRLISRTLAHMDTLFYNIRVFQRAARRVGLDSRASEQIGTMIAGLYLLHSTEKATDKFAEEWIKKYDWHDHTPNADETDPVRMVQHIAGHVVRHTDAGGRTSEAMLGDLITNQDSASHKTLRFYGILIESERVYIANRSQNLSKVFANTDWSIRWGNGLANLEGAKKHTVKYFSPAVKTSAVSLPLSLFLQHSEQRNMTFYPNDRYEEEIPL